MKTPPLTPEFAKFTGAVKKILYVSKADMKKLMDEHKESGKRLSKGSSSLGPAASSKIRASIGKS